MKTRLMRLVYRSKSRISHDDVAALDAIFMISRRNNKRYRIHGCLAQPDGHFVQVIEGDEPKVEALMERLRNDPRHSDIVVLGQWMIAAKLFEGWVMARPDITPLADQRFRVIDESDSGAQVTAVMLGLVKEPQSLYSLL